MLVISVSGHPGQGPNLSFGLTPEHGVYQLWIRDHCPWAPGRISVTLTDAQRRDLIRVLGGKPVEPAMVHADAPAEAERWQAELAAAREVVEAARPIVNAEHDVAPVDVYNLREAIRRYDERCGGGGTPTE